MNIILDHKTGDGKIIFTFKERLIIFFKGRLELPSLSLRHLGNKLLKLIATWNIYFKEEIQQTQTHDHTDIESK